MPLRAPRRHRPVKTSSAMMGMPCLRHTYTQCGFACQLSSAACLRLQQRMQALNRHRIMHRSGRDRAPLLLLRW